MSDINPPSDQDIENLQSQAMLLASITQSLQENLRITNEIHAATANQTGLIQSLNQGIVDSTKHFNDISEELKKTADLVQKISASSFSFLSGNILETLLENAERVKDTSSQATEDIKESHGKVLNRNEKFLERSAIYSEQMLSVARQNKQNAEQAALAAAEAAANSQEIADSSKVNSDCLSMLWDGVKWTVTFLAKTSVMLFRGAANVLLTAKNMLTGFVSSLVSMLKAITSLPFAIARLGAGVGNALRVELVEGLGQSFEDLKEKFDMSSYIGENISSMRDMSEKLMLRFKDPTDELVAYFGYGADGLKKYLTSYGELVHSLGSFSEVFAGEIRKSEQADLILTKLRSAAGHSLEDTKYLAIDAFTSMESLTDTTFKAVEASREMSKRYKIDFKNLSKNFMTLKRDIVLFGHLSYKELNESAAIMTKMGLEMKEAAAVFNKFSTFESASNAAAILGQTFGMNLNAMDMIKAEKPEEIFMMFREAMFDTGRTFDELSRYEKSIMVQQTGMSAEALKAMMNYSAAGLSFDEAREKYEKNTPEQKQLDTLKELRSTIKEFKKVLNSNSFFDAFTKGITKKLAYHTETRDTLMALSKGYEGLYSYAMNLDPELISKIVRPIAYVIDTMRSIFESDAFREGVSHLLKGFGDLLTSSFDITDEDIVYQKAKSKLNALDFTKLTPDQKVKYVSTIKELESSLELTSPIASDNQKTFEELQKSSKDRQGNQIDLKDYILKLLEKRKSKSKDVLLALKLEESNLDTAGVKVNNSLVKAADSQSENVGILGNITGKIVKALIIGTMTGATALLKAFNDKLKNTKLDADAMPSILSLLTNISKEEAKQLIDGLLEAIKDTFSQAGNLGFIGGFISKQMFLLFKEVAFFFADMFYIAIKGLFGAKLSLGDIRSTKTAERLFKTEEYKTTDEELLKQSRKKEKSEGFYKEGAKFKSNGKRSDEGLRGSFGRIDPVGDLIPFKDFTSSDSLSTASNVSDSDYDMLFKQLMALEKRREDKSIPEFLRRHLDSLAFDSLKEKTLTTRKGGEGQQLTISEANMIKSLFESTGKDAIDLYNILKSVINAGSEASSSLNMFGIGNTSVATNSKDPLVNTSTSQSVVVQSLNAVSEVTDDLAQMSVETPHASVSVSSEEVSAANMSREKLKEATAQLKEINDTPQDVETISVAPVLDYESLVALGQNLSKANLLKHLSDPRYTIGAYRFNLPDAKHSSGAEGDFSIQS